MWWFFLLERYGTVLPERELQSPIELFLDAGGRTGESGKLQPQKCCHSRGCVAQPGRMWLVRAIAFGASAFDGDNLSQLSLGRERDCVATGRRSTPVDLISQDEPYISPSPASLRAGSIRQRRFTIVALGPQHQGGQSGTASSPRDLPSSEIHGRAASASCSQCTKAFCLTSGISFCRDATEENVQTLCFQRDSNKDRVIVWGFILGTAGLLGWAALKRVNELREGKRAADAARTGAGRGNYNPVTTPN
ncbi:hypothetical protein CSUB01_06772 [Colletotrichum sublineola]|uniref:Uncharacterized protein n=1 Tax=Colletotrichum sublineola TaxID=1173701 RepID=A0A066XBG4_COLSU|nr:hypothetical protein CSUB01_06772 [Colletotrichum sublineola]